VEVVMVGDSSPSTDMTCPKIVLMASYPAWLAFLDHGHLIPLRRVMNDIKETESIIACSYPCAFPRTLGVHGSQPKRTDPGISTAIRNAKPVNHIRLDQSAPTMVS
jgi:hypothetical protein